jgi:putative phage-type endonuclease
MKILDIPQQTPEWYKEKAGRPSASSFEKIVTSKGEPSKQAEKYMLQLAGEKVIGMPEMTYQNDAMKRGVELEPEARLCYELMTGNNVTQVGMCIADDGYSCSPDGFVGEDGLVEIKCPILSTHVSYILDEQELVKDYWHQSQGQMLVTGRKWCDMLSYYPGLKTVVVRVNRDEVFIGKLEAELKKFVKQLNEVVNKIK